MSRTDDFLNQQQADMGSIQLAKYNADLINSDVVIEEQQKGMVKEQLDLEDELKKIEYLLKGYVWKEQKNGTWKWEEPQDKSLIIFSEYGVQKIINVINWYINKNTLLSNYEPEDVLIKMEDFATSLADNIFMKYELFFRQPSLDECKEELEKRIKKRVDIIKFANDLIGSNYNEQEIKAKVVSELEPMIEKELDQIRVKLMKDKLKDFDMIMRAVQDAVHSTYNRAIKGKERSSLRMHWNITETSNPNLSEPPIKKGWLRR